MGKFQIFITMFKDSMKTKKLSDKVKVWFSKTYWRPDDCIEEKDPKDFYINMILMVTTDIKFLAFYNLCLPV